MLVVYLQHKQINILTMLHSFKVSAWDRSSKQFIDCNFKCRKSTAKHTKLKRFADGNTYWFEGLTGSNWYRGGFYRWDNGFINASLTLDDNVQGVVVGNEVYLLRSIEVD